MLTIQTLADIAMKHATYMSDSMIIACVQRHYRTGEPLELRSRTACQGMDPMASEEIPGASGAAWSSATPTHDGSTCETGGISVKNPRV